MLQTGSTNTAVGKGMRIAGAGRTAFAITIIGLGILGLINPKFSPLWQPIPKSVPGRDLLIYLCAFISLVSGMGLLWERTAAFASRLLLTCLMIWLLVFRLPYIFISFTVDVWWASCQAAVMVAAAWMLYDWFATDWDRQHLGFALGDKGMRTARILYGLALIPFGLAHFIYLKATTDLVPGWLPGRDVAWAYFTGATFIAAGVAIVVDVYARLAAVLSVLQLGLFTLLVWVPVVFAGPSPSQWVEVVISWALTVASWLVADSYDGVPLLAVGKLKTPPCRKEI